jgi:hypothetical protein
MTGREVSASGRRLTCVAADRPFRWGNGGATNTRQAEARQAYAGPVSVEMEPEGVLLHLLDYDSPPEGEPRADSSLWHVADAERARTWCGIDVGYGMPRRRWSETPEGQRCQICLDSLSPDR